jgi:hypothetical protein
MPGNVILRGDVGKSIVTSVRIIPETKYPFKILDIQTLNQQNIRCTLKEIKPSEGSGYILTVENLKKEKGRYYDMISLKTDSKLRPLIKISVHGTILDPKPTGKK